jgi:uncharacterized protein YjbI with pentapeptide repeats
MPDGKEIASEEHLETELELPTDERAIPEPETSPNEIPETAPSVWPVDCVEPGCPVNADETLTCGRKLHYAPGGMDKQPVCLMHSNDENKQSGPLFAEFWRTIEEILDKAGDGEAHFEFFVFPRLPDSMRFNATCRFDQAIFTQRANFSRAIFRRRAYFWGATFIQDATFEQAMFEQGAEFDQAKFKQDAKFNVARFKQNATFSQAAFTQNAAFRSTIFKGDTDFGSATFTQVADFRGTRLHGTAYWTESQFLDYGKFRFTTFKQEIEGTPAAVFSLAKFAKPENVVFERVDLSRVLFVNCDVSEVLFTSSVQWPKRKGNRGLAIFEEKVLLDPNLSRIRDFFAIDHGAVEQIYHQLKKNYDVRLEYRKANEFHFGEMEMRRLEARTYPIFLKPWGWARRWLGPEAWYKYGSDYGNSFTKPAWWLAGTLLAAALSFPIPGLVKQHAAGSVDTHAQKLDPPETYSWNKNESWTDNLWTEGKLLGKSLIAAVDSASFQRNPEYTPNYPWGRVIAYFETLLTSTLLGLFLLAIRRQFRR